MKKNNIIIAAVAAVACCFMGYAALSQTKPTVLEKPGECTCVPPSAPSSCAPSR